MREDRGYRADEQLRVFEEGIGRWNTQINLVTRVDTQARVRGLTRQCRAGWWLVRDAIDANDWPTASLHIDLGSGGGFPGLVWASERWREGRTGSSLLVEPRVKRAWFLRRAARTMGLESVFVLQARWGEMSVPEEIGNCVEAVLVSVKALRLGDEEILNGMTESFGVVPLPREVAIARFLDPELHDSDWLEERFAARHDTASQPWLQDRIETVGVGDPRLLITRYSLP